MKFTYLIHFPNRDNYTFQCEPLQLKKKVAEKLTNIPMDQIVLIDKDNKLFDLNKSLTQTQTIQNQNIEQIFKQVDLQTLIMEWSKMKIDNDQYHKTIEDNKNKIIELTNLIQKHNQEQKLNQTESEKNNNTINQLRDDLEQQTQQYSQERQKLSDTIKDLKSLISENTKTFEQEKLELDYQLRDLSEKLKTTENQIKQQATSIQQLNAQIKEKENTIQNITLQSQQQQQQISQQWQQYFTNYQQLVTQQNQTYEASIKELTEEKDSLDKKFKAEKKTNQITTQERNDFETQFNTVQAQNKTLQANVKKFQKDIENIKQEHENLESEKNKAAQVGQNVTNEAQKLRQDLSKLKNDFNQIQYEKEQISSEFENFQKQHALFALQTQNTLQTANQEHEEEIKTLNNKINLLINDGNNLKKSILDAQRQIKEKESQIEAAQQEIQNLKFNLDQTNSNGNNLGQQKKNLEQTTKLLQDELNEAKRQYQIEKNNFRTAENEKAQLKGELNSKDIELTSEKANHDATRREKNQYQEQCKKMADQSKQLAQQSNVELKRLTIQVEVAEKKIERVVQNFGDTKILEKISGPLDKIMASEFKINRFTEDPNSQSDNAQYNLIEITLQFDKYTQYVKEGKFFLIDECFQYGNKVNITATRSIQANAESEFYKGYLIRINESAQADLKTKTLLRKDLKLQNLAFQNQEEAARLAGNNIFCWWLQNQFNKDLEIAKLQPQRHTIQRQFIIENEAKKEYYYCEMVEEGPFQKINGGKFVPQKDDIHQYFNGLSSYSYKMFEQQLILTNFQVCGNYVYDMIVHTNHKGLFSPLDQGSHESMTFADIITKQPADIMSKSWNETVKGQAEKYLRG